MERGMIFSGNPKHCFNFHGLIDLVSDELDENKVEVFIKITVLFIQFVFLSDKLLDIYMYL